MKPEPDNIPIPFEVQEAKDFIIRAIAKTASISWRDFDSLSEDGKNKVRASYFALINALDHLKSIM